MSSKKLVEVDLAQLLENAQLPALPQSAISLLEISQDPDNGPVEFAAPIEADPGLAGQVLRFVNSSYFGFSREICSVKLAITLVGVRTIKNFSLWSAVFSLMPNPKCGQLDLRILWQDSLRRALFARLLAKNIGYKDTEDVFAASLLQDMAVPLLVKEIPDVYAGILAARGRDARRLSEIERERLGWTHADAAGVMARQWDLPENFATLIESHVEIERWLDGGEECLGKAIVALSALLPSSIDSRWNEFEQFESAYGRIMPIGGARISSMLEIADEEFIEFSPLLKISAPKRTLLDYYDEITVPAS